MFEPYDEVKATLCPWWMRLLAGWWQGGQLQCYLTVPWHSTLLRACSPGRASTHWRLHQSHKNQLPLAVQLGQPWQGIKQSQNILGNIMFWTAGKQFKNHLQYCWVSHLNVFKFFVSSNGTVLLFSLVLWKKLPVIQQKYVLVWIICKLIENVSQTQLLMAHTGRMLTLYRTH